MRNALASLINESAKMKRLITLILILTITLLSQAQNKPKLIKSKKDFFHTSTSLNFPLNIDEYKRIDIYAFDKKRTNIGVTYENKTVNSATTFTIYVYPAGDGTEDRLRSEYLVSIQSIANNTTTGIDINQYATSYENSDYRINGFKADIKKYQSKPKSCLTLFECGSWFFKIRMTSENLDSIEFVALEKRILNFFQPTELVKNKHLNPKASINFAPGAFIDSVMLGSNMGSVFKKLEWVLENVDSLERAAGFPSLYLNMYIEALHEFIKFENKHPEYTKSERTERYLFELNSIINSGYLEEFIMEQYNMVMIVPEHLKLDYESYQEWKLSNPISINLNEMFYIISFKE